MSLFYVLSYWPVMYLILQNKGHVIIFALYVSLKNILSFKDISDVEISQWNWNEKWAEIVLFWFFQTSGNIHTSFVNM